MYSGKLLKDPGLFDPSESNGPAVRKKQLFNAEVVALFSAVAAALYVFLRFPFAILYGKLGTTPEEVGLGYFELLAQSSVMVILVAGFATLLTSYPLLLIFNIALLRASITQLRVFLSRGYPRKSWRQLPEMSDDEFEEHIRAVRAAWSRVRGGDNLAENDVLSRHKARYLRRKTGLTEAEEHERLRLECSPTSIGHIFKSVWRRNRRSLPWFLGAWSLVFVSVILPLSFSSLGERIRDCRGSGDVPVIGDFGGQRVQAFDTATQEPRFAARNLLLLGSDGTKYVLFDCRDDATIRVPVDSFSLIHVD